MRRPSWKRLKRSSSEDICPALQREFAAPDVWRSGSSSHPPEIRELDFTIRKWDSPILLRNLDYNIAQAKAHMCLHDYQSFLMWIAGRASVGEGTIGRSGSIRYMSVCVCVIPTIRIFKFKYSPNPYRHDTSRRNFLLFHFYMTAPQKCPWD